MMAFLKEYGTVEQCERAPEEMRWPEGYRCPVCQGSRCSRYDREGRRYWQCSHCRHQTTVISGTIFEAMRFTQAGIGDWARQTLAPGTEVYNRSAALVCALNIHLFSFNATPPEVSQCGPSGR
jgi:ribosomal protein L37AE/L43A